MLKAAGVLAAGCITAFIATSASAMPVMPTLDADSSVQKVRDGCGPGRWRGPWGHCRSTPYYGRMPGGWVKCRPGYWVGPWGHCRDTPYHGRLPNGGWRS